LNSPRTPKAGAPTEEQDWDHDPAVLAAVQALLVTLGKTFRAYQLYDENNPVRKRFGEQLRTELTALWQQMEQLVLRVDEDHMYLGDVTIYHSESRNDSLAFLFFKDGIREINLLPGLESEELDRFLGVLQKARKLVPEGDDLLTVLWEADLRYFEYQYVDLLAEVVAMPEAGAGNTQAEMKAAHDAEEAEASAAERQRARHPALFTRIVAVADSFDAGTSVRSYQYEPWPPDAVLQEMRDNPKRGLDTLLVKVLITATGVYPVGTLVILDTHELAIVAQVNKDPSLLHRPVVRVISDPVGLPLPQPKTIDLAESDPATGAPRHQIIKTTDPQKYGIRVSDYLISA